MMGKSHAMSGSAIALTGAALSIGPIAVGQQDLAVILLYTSVFIGGALWCDWDSNSATVVHAFGAFGKMIHELVNAIGLFVYNLTKSKRDEVKNNGHRTFFHTPIAAILTGAIISGLVSIPGHVALWGKHFTIGQVIALFIMWAFLHVGVTAIFEKTVKKAKKRLGVYLIMAISLVVTGVVSFFLPENDQYWWLGLAAGGGMLVHILGDLPTKMGVPFLWPIKIRGKRWYDISIPSFMRFKAGGSFEQAVLFPLFLVISCISLALCIFPNLDQMITGWFH